jgi:hypothetical protein
VSTLLRFPHSAAFSDSKYGDRQRNRQQAEISFAPSIGRQRNQQEGHQDQSFAETTAVLISDLRFALEVMEDQSHLGLNAERAAKLRTLMRRRISAAEEVFSKGPIATTSLDTLDRQESAEFS